MERETAAVGLDWMGREAEGASLEQYNGEVERWWGDRASERASEEDGETRGAAGE